MSRLQTVTLAHGVSVSGFLLIRCNFPSPRKIFLYPGPCLRVAHRRGGEGAPLAGSCKWPNSPNFPSLGPALGQDTPGRALPGCLECWPRQRGLAKVSGKWVTVHCTLAHCTLYRPLLYCTRVTPYLHLQFIKSNCREDFYSHSTYCQLRLMEKYFPP